MENTNAEIPFTKSAGIDYAALIAYSAIDSSALTREKKRDMLYSVLCFRCLFDNRMAVNPDPILLKYDCLKYPEPQRLELYDLFYELVILNKDNYELKAMWYLMFPYVALAETPHDEECFAKLISVLFDDKVFEKVLSSRYSAAIPCTPEEMHAAFLPETVIIWYLPYLTYKSEKTENGLSREEVYLQKALALGLNEEVYTKTEQLLNSFPDNEEIMLINVAARIALFKGKADENRAMLGETLRLLDDYLTNKRKREVYFLYYRGLTLLGLMDIEAAKKQFNECIVLDPSFSLAKLMLAGLK